MPGSYTRRSIPALGALLLFIAILPSDIATAGVDDRHCRTYGSIVSAALEGEERSGFALDTVIPTDPKDISLTSGNVLTSTTLNVSSDLWRTGWTGDRPSYDLIERWIGEAPAGLGDCYQPVSAKLKRLDSEAPSSRDRALVVSVGKIAIDKSGKNSLVYIDAHGPGLLGWSRFYRLRRSSSKWIVTGRRIVTIS